MQSTGVITGSESTSFRILSIDGGGIRGIIPARFLCELEAEVSRQQGTPIRLCDYFDLICGTSTGGIIAIGLGLGMSAKDIANLYQENAQRIFGHSNFLFNMYRSARQIVRSKHSNKGLSDILKAAFAPYSSDGNTQLGHALTRLAIPAYSASLGRPVVFKTPHLPNLTRDYRMPAFQVALATSAAPTYFSAQSFDFVTTSGQVETWTNLVDGGIFANNPAVIGLTEALAIGVDLSQIKLLSLGTGSETFTQPYSQYSFGLKRAWGIASYWLSPLSGNPLIEMMMQGTSAIADNTLKVLSNGIGKGGPQKFRYDRLQVSFDGKGRVGLDTTAGHKLNALSGYGTDQFHREGSAIIDAYFTHPATPYKPHRSL